MTIDVSRTFIDPLFLIEMVWPDATYRYLYGAGFVNWNSYNWLTINDTQGQILSLGTFSEGGEEVPNLDISLGFTATLGGYVKLGKSANLTVNIWRAERNPITGALQVDTQSVWKCNEVAKMVWGENIDLVLMADVGRKLSKSDAFKTSSEHRKRLVTTTDYAFDKISGVKSGVASIGTSNSGGGTGYNYQNNTFMDNNFLS